MAKTFQALLIDPDKQEVKTVYLNTKDNDIDLEHCYELMGCQLVEFVYFGDKEILICDEEGLLKENNPFRLEGVGQEIYVGKSLIVSDNGENCGSLSEHQIFEIRKKISFPEVVEEE